MTQTKPLTSFLCNRWVSGLLRHHLLGQTTFNIPTSLSFYLGLSTILTDIYITLLPFFTPTPPSTSIFDHPHHLYSFYHYALTLQNYFNLEYFTFTQTHPNKKPPFWAKKLFCLVPITRLTTRCVRLTKTNIKESIEGATWESIRVPARTGWEATSVHTDGFSASVMYKREGTKQHSVKRQ